MAESQLNLFQRINEVRKKIDYVKKEKAVETYKAVTHDQITALVRDHLVSFGIVIIPNLISSTSVLTGTATGKGTPYIRVEAIYEFTFVNIDDSNDTFKTSVAAHAIDHGDKAPGKALSYAKKAVVLKVFEIETGEDDESRYETSTGLSEDRINLLILNIKTEADDDKKKSLYKQAIQECVAANDVSAANAIKAGVSP
jgi:hypothetical protein